MASRRLRRSRPLLVFCLLAAVVALFGSPRPAWTDDTALLRFSTQNPYLMILLDTSRSMNLAIGSDDPLPAGGDDPDSRIYASKEALFSVFHGVKDVNFGFMSFNQDQLRVRGKHWLYYVDKNVNALPAVLTTVGWPVSSQNPPALVSDTDGDGILNVDHNPRFTDNGATNGTPADLVTFGTAYKSGATVLSTACDASDPTDCLTPATACANPISVTTTAGRAKLNAFAKNGSQNLTTTMWVKIQGNKVYRLTFVRDASTTLGQSPLPITISADEVSSCSSIPVVSAGTQVKFSTQAALGQYLYDDNGPAGEKNGEDITANYWPWKDAVNEFTCTNSRPFNGYGGEGNYDSGKKPIDDGILVPPAFANSITNDDTFCLTPTDCIKLKPITQTTYDTRGRPLDTGDFLPWDWKNDNQKDFIRRLAPNCGDPDTCQPDFRIASYFTDTGDPATQVRHLNDDSQVPLVAESDTQITRALIDLRCWYMGTAEETGNSKCRSSPFGTDFSGWRNIACNQDSGDPNYGCRKPFFIIISDGDADSSDCQENAGVAAVSDLDQFSAVKTWYLQVGPTKNGKGCQGSGIGNQITNAGGGECVVINNKQELLDTINKILGIIREQTRAFASAAVPTVQTTADQSIYVSNFTPLRTSPIWDGHVNAFLKPIPLTNGKPDTSTVCDPPQPPPPTAGQTRSQCFLWDAGKVVVNQQYNATTPLSWQTKTQRHVYYPVLRAGNNPPAAPVKSGSWPTSARLLQPTVANGTDPELDLWSAFGLAPANTTNSNDPLDDPTRDQANTAITNVFKLKTATVQGETTPRQFLLGDVFHSDPVVIGSPTDLRYFALNVGKDKNTVATPDCKADTDPTSPTGDHGYQCFFARQQYRRKVLVLGQNDGMLHTYYAGGYSTTLKGFTDGTGNEMFAFMPRTVMPAVFAMSQAGNTKHDFTVDGSPVAADVFIDPLFTGGTPDPADRQWRSVLLSGMREGGRGYFALDVTQPDTLRDTTINGVAAIVPTAAGTVAATDAAWVPDCLNKYGALPSGCGPIPYGAPLWEFTDNSNDQLAVVAAPGRAPMDEDSNGVPDLGDTWSNPNIGRIRICTGGDCTKNLEDRYVAIFGGGLDPSNKSQPSAGTFLYIVDIERGQVLYKRQMPDFAGNAAGAIPSSPAAVDTDQDGYFDRVYVGTTGGYLYRVDVGKNSSGQYPELKNQLAHTTSGVDFEVKRIDPSFWQPKLIFDATWDSVKAAHVERPFYYRPSVFFVGKLGTYGIAFGTGEREDLWTVDGQNGRFWVMVDDTDTATTLPYDESMFQRLDANLAPTIGAQDLLVKPNSGLKRGWYFVLGKNERLITPGFSLFGVMFFSSYEPLSFATTDANCDPLNPPAGGCPPIVLSCSDKKQNVTGYCSKTGTSRLFVVNATNGDGLLPNTSGALTRYKAIAQFVTQPFTEPGSNKNQPPGGSGTNADTLTPDDIKVMNIIKGLFPRECKFANYRVDVKTIASDTSVQRIAPVPMCVIEKNWKEF